MQRLLAKLGTFATVVMLAACGTAEPLSFTWPPEAGQPYPALELRGLDGELVSLTAYHGKVLLIEPIGMT